MQVVSFRKAIVEDQHQFVLRSKIIRIILLGHDVSIFNHYDAGNFYVHFQQQADLFVQLL